MHVLVYEHVFPCPRDELGHADWFVQVLNLWRSDANSNSNSNADSNTDTNANTNTDSNTNSNTYSEAGDAWKHFHSTTSRDQ